VWLVIYTYDYKNCYSATVTQKEIGLIGIIGGNFTHIPYLYTRNAQVFGFVTCPFAPGLPFFKSTIATTVTLEEIWLKYYR